MTSTRKILFCLTLLAVVGLAYAPGAMAQHGSGGHGYSYGGHGSSYGGHGSSYGGLGSSYGGYSRHSGYRAPVYHPPSVHTDRAFHGTSLHYTPGRGLHVDGHYDYVPHYTRGHIDYNRRYHH